MIVITNIYVAHQSLYQPVPTLLILLYLLCLWFAILGTLEPSTGLHNNYKPCDSADMAGGGAGVVVGGVGGGGGDPDSQTSTSGPSSLTVEHRKLQPGEENSVSV